MRCGRREKAYLGSSGAHHTPTPATARGPPFPLHAPSEYTISTVVFLGAAILGGWTVLGAGVVIAVDMGWGAGFEIGVVNWFRDARVGPVLLELVETMLGGVTVDIEGVAVVVCGFAGYCRRLDLYHRSASGSVLNFLNLAPGNPWTYVWVSSLQTQTPFSCSSKMPRTVS